jgi:hypothetical protein
LTFASISNDQRVKVWCVTIPTAQLFKEGFEMEGIHVEKIAEFWTIVADAAAIEVLETAPRKDRRSISSVQRREQELLVIGVGMETLKVPMQC